MPKVLFYIFFFIFEIVFVDCLMGSWIKTQSSIKQCSTLWLAPPNLLPTLCLAPLAQVQ